MSDSVQIERKPRNPRRRLLLLFVIGLGLGSMVLLYNHFWLARPVGTGPAGPTVSRDVFAKPWAHRPVVLLGIGDSVTAGYGASKGHSYFARLVTNPPDEFDDMKGLCLSTVLPGLESKNIAVSGSTSLQHIRHIEKLQPYPPEVLGIVVMSTGGNDVLHDYGRTPPREGAMFGASIDQTAPWIANFERRLNAMLDRIVTCFPGGCHIFLANIYDPTDGVGDITSAGLPAWPDGLKVHAAYNEVIDRTAATRPNVHLVNMHDAFLGHGIHCRQFWRDHYRREDPHYWYYYNLEDPNDRGYDAIRRLFLIEIAKHLPAHCDAGLPSATSTATH